MGTAAITAIAAAFLVVVVLGWAVVAYNRLVRLRTQVRSSWAQIDVQLKRRHSLVPNVVETVKAYAGHERETFAVVTAARAAAESAGTGATTQASAEAALSSALGRLLAVAEAYPQLRANENFAALQTELARTEDKIAYARQFFNTAVQAYNAAVQSVPTNLIARLGGHRPESYFEATAEERGDVDVRF
ncbi:LemA protein [Spirilliplanes yamanashiensis]|nr:LemA family protein [Spirilliplanes yamanashiensis]MDP9814738.1 LemA protein [Spirilliplanes yamanashiensis]